MDNIEFDFDNTDYLFFILLEEQKVQIGIIELKKEKIRKLSENEKEKFLKNIFNLDYEVFNKLKQKVNPRLLTRIEKYINKSIYFYCDAKVRKDLLIQNMKKISSDLTVVWRIKL